MYATPYIHTYINLRSLKHTYIHTYITTEAENCHSNIVGALSPSSSPSPLPIHHAEETEGRNASPQKSQLYSKYQLYVVELLRGHLRPIENTISDSSVSGGSGSSNSIESSSSSSGGCSSSGSSGGSGNSSGSGIGSSGGGGSSNSIESGDSGGGSSGDSSGGGSKNKSSATSSGSGGSKTQVRYVRSDDDDDGKGVSIPVRMGRVLHIRNANAKLRVCYLTFSEICGDTSYTGLV